MVELTTLFGLAQTLAIIVGVIIALMELRHMRQTRDTELETRQAQLFMNLYEAWRTPDFRKSQNWILRVLEYEDSADFHRKYGAVADPDTFASWASVAAFYEGIGVLVKRGLIDIDLVNDLLNISIISSWEKMGPEIVESRERGTGHPQLWDTFEYLYNEIIKREQQRPELKT